MITDNEKAIADLFLELWNDDRESYTKDEKTYIEHLLSKGLAKKDITIAIRFREGFIEGGNNV